ncbi:OmpP1/FadL family transporter, partial [Bacteroidota bacterium]
AGGFQINEHGARAMAMAGAFTALANYPSTIFYNPAGLTQLQGTWFSGGVTLIKPSSTFRGPSPSITEYELDDAMFTPINLYITHQITQDLYAGVSVNNQYGLGTTWDENWIGKYLAIETEIRTFFFNPTIAYNLTDNFSIGVGLQFAYGDVIIARKNSLSPFEGDAYVDLEGNGTAWGFTAGLHYKPIPELALGLSFRSETNFDFEGDAVAEAPTQLSTAVPTGSISAPLTTPANITFGVAVFPCSHLTLSFDFQYIGWSSYDKLEVTFNDIVDENNNPLVSSSIRDYDNTYILRLGTEYKLNNELDIRGGLLYDNNPVKDERLDPTLPDADRLGLNIGLGYKISPNLFVDLAYMFLRFDEREIKNSVIDYTSGSAKFNGVYNSVAHLLGLNFTYNLK